MVSMTAGAQAVSSSLSSIVALCLSAMLLVSCAANPGAAPIEPNGPGGDDTATSQLPSTSNATSTAQAARSKPDKEQSTELTIGIDPVFHGFNPHLAADDSYFTRLLGSLVLPSVFQDGVMNRDVVRSADVIAPQQDDQGNPFAMTVQYRIQPEAQWSDGTPITVSDFQYLARRITNAPSALDSALYREIADIRSADGGKTVIVSFHHRVENWQRLFAQLLPSHILRGKTFSEALASTIPVSAGRYLIRDVDRQRGVIILNRNDRFWGENPAQVEKLIFREIRLENQATELVQSKQIAYLNVTPTQTLADSLALVPGAQLNTYTTDLELSISANAALTAQTRRELFSLIDVELLAKIAAGRTDYLDISSNDYADEVQQTQLAPELAELASGIRIGVDPEDPVAERSANTLKNMYLARGYTATVITTDTATLLEDYIPQHKVDLVVGWRNFDMLSRYQCAFQAQPSQLFPEYNSKEEEQKESVVEDSAQTDAILGTNFSNFCDSSAQEFITNAIAGERSAEEITQWTHQVEQEQALSISIMRDTRVSAREQEFVAAHTDAAPDTELWQRNSQTLDTILANVH
ncbi:ABC transporter family substrate-binding protein [Corynebacterium sp. sy017]|uniref:ABC transporter family substrate-binding protein n=2 Tax=unclassified Corynebacterium TaxID=2624378 RepID=UPI0011867FF3|nr:ABC transporter family substrate-binding protein [Corynebacterium sp. SY003]MBP3088945.1 ABC transporter family substrate-binding protein [Corynebacterium sp. sy017]TSD91272.1 ABC transporter family substrate-binding protein [Corynebacterium sp. SY003]